MDKLVIRGGNPLLGTVRISGAKNAALPCMAAALLTDEPVILENIPQVRDIETTRKLLAAMGAEVELGYGRAHHRTTICARTLNAPEASYELVKTMRSSTLVCPEGAPSVPAPSICISKVWSGWARRSRKSTATSRPSLIR
jgi:UDP-N-acetylglucosamine 1-carboxyvinyltransferase